MKYLLLSLLILTSCTDSKPEKKLSNKDIEHARCICKNSGHELRVVRREGNSIQLICKDGTGWTHADDSYTEGCSQ